MQYTMRWWPFQRKKVDLTNEPQIKGTRTWLQDLHALCEGCYNDHAKGKEEIIILQNAWKEAHQKMELPDKVFDGLERRAASLLLCDSEEWLNLLNDESFWKPGWRRSEQSE